MLPGCEQQGGGTMPGNSQHFCPIRSPNPAGAIVSLHPTIAAMRIVPALVYAVLGAGALAGGGWVIAWVGTPPRAVTVEPAPDSRSVAASLRLDSSPEGADATTSFGWSCRTPCSIELVAEAPFTVTFAHPGFAPMTVPVEIRAPAPGASDATFAPDTVFAALRPLVAAAKPKIAPGPERTAGIRAPRNVPRAAPTESWASQAWKMFSSVFH
jgi:hypothetical protein